MCHLTNELVPLNGRIVYVMCSGVLCLLPMLVLHYSWPVYCWPRWSCDCPRTVTSRRWHSMWCACPYSLVV